MANKEEFFRSENGKEVTISHETEVPVFMSSEELKKKATEIEAAKKAKQEDKS